jgi:hypothetical protein
MVVLPNNYPSEGSGELGAFAVLERLSQQPS